MFTYWDIHFACLTYSHIYSQSHTHTHILWLTYSHLHTHTHTHIITEVEWIEKKVLVNEPHGIFYWSEPSKGCLHCIFMSLKFVALFDLSPVLTYVNSNISPDTKHAHLLKLTYRVFQKEVSSLVFRVCQLS